MIVFSLGREKLLKFLYLITDGELVTSLEGVDGITASGLELQFTLHSLEEGQSFKT